LEKDLLINFLILNIFSNLFLTIFLIFFYIKCQKYKRKNKKLHQKSICDPMTDLYNYEHFESRLKKEELPYTLMMLDIDNFKKINDHYGHQVGDEVIKYLSKRLKNNLKNTDIICRYGGDEFIIALLNCDINKSNDIAKKIKTKINNKYKTKNNDLINITTSIGIYEPDSKDTIRSMVYKVDQALYQAKDNVKNTIINYNKI